jgi:hypothetical protein
MQRTMAKRATDVAKAGRRGRPPKYGRPSQVVALTLPQEAIDALGRLHSDLGWAIVTLVEKNSHPQPPEAPLGHAELVEIGDGQKLIVVNSDMLKSIPGVQLVPLSATQSFLALDPLRGMADLELAVVDRLEEPTASGRERQAVGRLRNQLRKWRHDPHLQFVSRSIIMVSKRRLPGRRESAP